MKKLILTIVVAMGLSLTVTAQGDKQTTIIDRGVRAAAEHLDAMTDSLDVKTKIVSPRTFEKGRIVYHSLESWTSGFYPGSLWYLYEMTGDVLWRTRAEKYTQGMEQIKHYTGNHDIGFMIFCSFGNGLRLTGNEYYKEVITTAAETLMKRYRPKVGVIQSWNSNRKWMCPVIIDNMMNLELLFEATKISGDSSFWRAAISHADRTIENHYRSDNSCYHVIDYDQQTGVVRNRNTHQGYSDASSWSRGQAWGLYGYTMCYRYTRDDKYLEQAEKIINFIFKNSITPSGLIPLWDYNAPNLKEELRDASAAAITAAALYELCRYSKNSKKLKATADRIIELLSSNKYTAAAGTNGHFLLMHSVGSKPHNVEIDVPLVYADYYYLEALKRKYDLEKPLKKPRNPRLRLGSAR